MGHTTTAAGETPIHTLFQPIHAARASDEIASQIRAELAEGRLQAGSRLPSERVMSEQFGVSRNTLREALRSLEHAGLIRLQKGSRGGAFITEQGGRAIVGGLMDLYHLGAIQPSQLTQARIWLEEIVVREACHLITDEHIERLEANVREAADATDAGDFDLRARKHMEFHRLLAEITGNPVMVLMMNGVLDVLASFIAKLGDRDNPYVLPSRRRMLKHLRERNPEAAVAEMTSHLKRLQQRYMSLMDRT